jgi:hypothetical protein
VKLLPLECETENRPLKVELYLSGQTSAISETVESLHRRLTPVGRVERRGKKKRGK